MIKIIIDEKKLDDDFFVDSKFDVHSKIICGDDLTWQEATYAWIRALEIAGYHPTHTDKIKRFLEGE